VYLEKIAAQQLLRYPLEYHGKMTGKSLAIQYIQAPRGANAKDERIRALEPVFRNFKFWSRKDQTQFDNEYRTYPSSRTIDILDTLGYANSMFDNIRYSDAVGIVANWNSRRKAALAEAR
jgi:hypothetical protein